MAGLSEYLNDVYYNVWDNRKELYKQGLYTPRELYNPTMKIEDLKTLHRFSPDLFTSYDMEIIESFDNDNHFVFRCITDTINHGRIYNFKYLFPDIHDYNQRLLIEFPYLENTNIFVFFIHSIKYIELTKMHLQFKNFEEYILSKLYVNTTKDILYMDSDIYAVKSLKHIMLLPNLLNERHITKCIIYKATNGMIYHTPKKIGLCKDLRYFIISFLIDDFDKYKYYLLNREHT